jgi:two-component system sensor histidine kinase KdpD
MPAADKLLVAVGPSPHSEFLIARTKELADRLGARWLALHVDSGAPRGPAAVERVEARLAQARALGGDSAVVADSDVAERIIAEARRRGCSMIVVGRSGLSPERPFPRAASISDRLARGAGAIAVIVVQDSERRRTDLTPAALRTWFGSGPKQYLLLGLAFLALLAAGAVLAGPIGYRSVALVYLAAVIGLSLVARPLPVAAFAVASAAALNFFFIPPYYTLAIAKPEDLLLFAVYFLSAAVTGSLVATVRANERLYRDKERRASFLSRSLQGLAACRSIPAAAEAAAAVAAEFYSGRATVELDDPENPLTAAAGGADPTAPPRFNPVAADGQAIGRIGVAGAGRWTKADDDLMAALGRALALVVDRERSEAARLRAAVQSESDRLSRVLLDMVSHELRTPLTAVTGAVSALCDDSLAEKAEARRQLLANALNAADRLNSVVEDLLSASRLGSGSLRLRLETADAGEIAGLALALAGPELAGRPVAVAVADDCGPLTVDQALVARMAANLVKNAARYSRPDGRIELSIARADGGFRIAVSDDGPGLPAALAEAPFHKFVRGPQAPGRGLGLGLAICEGIAAAHGGGLSVVANAADRFAVAAFLPDKPGAERAT